MSGAYDESPKQAARTAWLRYICEQGTVHAVASTNVNTYLREIAGEEIPAKVFRTWAGTVLAAVAFAEACLPSRKIARYVIAGIAAQLGNTAAVCRKCYIHPAILDQAENGSFSLRVPPRGHGGLSAIECAVLARLKRAPPR